MPVEANRAYSRPPQARPPTHPGSLYWLAAVALSLAAGLLAALAAVR